MVWFVLQTVKKNEKCAENVELKQGKAKKKRSKKGERESDTSSSSDSESLTPAASNAINAKFEQVTTPSVNDTTTTATITNNNNAFVVTQITNQVTFSFLFSLRFFFAQRSIY